MRGLVDALFLASCIAYSCCSVSTGVLASGGRSSGPMGEHVVETRKGRSRGRQHRVRARSLPPAPLRRERSGDLAEVE